MDDLPFALAESEIERIPPIHRPGTHHEAESDANAGEIVNDVYLHFALFFRVVELGMQRTNRRDEFVERDRLNVIALDIVMLDVRLRMQGVAETTSPSHVFTASRYFEITSLTACFCDSDFSAVSAKMTLLILDLLFARCFGWYLSNSAP